MAASFADISVTRDFDVPVELLFAHWTCPETRQRWEAGPDIGRRYEAFDTRECSVEKVIVAHEGNDVGYMLQRILRLEANSLLVSAIEGHFGGRVTVAMCVVTQFEATDSGSRLTGRGQVADFTGEEPKERHEVGRQWIRDRFATDIAEHGPVRTCKGLAGNLTVQDHARATPAGRKSQDGNQ